MGKRISKRAKKQLLNILFLVLLIGITLTVLLLSNRELNFENILNFLSECNYWYIAAAFVCMLLFIVFEGLSLHVIARRLGCKTKISSSLAYSSADVYYSAITPSASGGQPASAYYMVRDGMGGGVTGFTLVFNLISYTAAIIVIGIAAIIAYPSLYSQIDNGFVRFLVIAGFVIQALLLGFFIACMICHRAVLKCGNGLIGLLSRMKIVKRKEKWQEKLRGGVEKYKNSLLIIKQHPSLVAEALILNVAQRVSQTLIPCFVCLAAAPSASFLELFAMQSFVLLGYNSIPLPGGVGAYEYLYLNIYCLSFENSFILSAMMVSRTISYYISIIVSGVYTWIYHARGIKKPTDESFAVPPESAGPSNVAADKTELRNDSGGGSSAEEEKRTAEDRCESRRDEN